MTFHIVRELCKHPETVNALKEKPTGKEIREFLERYKLKTDRNTVTG